MYGRQTSRNHYSRQMNLMRVRPHDKRLYHRRRRYAGLIRKLMRLFLPALLILAFCACVVLLIPDSGALDSAEVTSASVGKLPENKLTDPEDPVPGESKWKDIVEVAEEEEPHIPLVAIDPGHGGEDEGCSRGDVLEKEVNLEIARLLAKKLQEYGIETLLIRADNDTQLTLTERVTKAQEAGADIYVSIHQNAIDQDNSSARGIETWYCQDTEGSRRLAQLVHDGAVDRTGAVDRDLRETRDLYVIREASVPACLIETGFLSNEGERTALTTPDYQEKLAAGIAQGIDLYFHPKTMYLTFDDGPSEENTSRILDILKERGIKATFFVIGGNVLKHPEIARRIVEEGHTIGIHCNQHDYKKIYQSVESYLEDFQAAYDAVYQVTGVEPKLFRFPGGSVNAYNKNVYKDIIEEMTERGFIYFDWNASLEDAVSKSSPEKLIENALSSTLNRKKVVMLAHDIVYNTTLCLEDLLDSLPEYKMEPLTPEVTPIQFKISD